MHDVMLPGNGAEVRYVWLGVPGASPSVKYFDGRPISWNPLSGVDREVDELWIQAEVPPPGTHYAWLGEPHASVSVRFDGDGNETARNPIIPPSTAAIVQPIGATVSYRDGVVTATSTYDGAHQNLPRIQRLNSNYNATPVTPGEQFHLQAEVRHSRGLPMHLDAWFTDADGGFVRQVRGANVLADGWKVAHVSGTVPDNAAYMGIHLPVDTSTAAGSSRIGDVFEVRHFAPFETYFDGSTVSDRAHDLWYNQAGVPHEWVNGTNGQAGGWDEADDRFTPVPDGFMRLPVDTSFTGDTPNIIPPPADTTLLEPQARVIVNDREQKVIDYSITQSMGDTLSGDSGLIASTADVTIADQTETVTRRRVTPWSPLAVRRGEPVTIEAGYKDALAPQLVGVIDGTSGGANDPTRLEITDRYAALQQEVTLDPLLATMPPYDDGQPFVHVGLTPTYITSMLLRECGFYATPPHRFGAAVNVPMNGSMLPEYGNTYRCSRIGDANEVPDFERAPWGQAVKNVTARYRPSPFDHSGRPFEIQMLVGDAGTSGTTIVAAYWGDQYVRVTVGASRNVSFQINTGSGNTTVVSLSGSQMDGATMVSARVSGSTWTLTADNGETASATRTWPWSAMFSETSVTVPANATQIGGLQVGYLQTPVTKFTPTADLGPAAFPHTLRAMPAIVRQRVANLLRDQAKAELAAFWINSQGVLVWRNRFDLVSGSPVRTVTSTRDLLDLNWREPSATTTRSIKVTGERPLINLSSRATITVHQGGKKTLDSGQEFSEFFQPPANEDWIMPNTNLNWLTASVPDIGGYHLGRRSWVSMVVVSQDRNADGGVDEEWVNREDQPLEKIDPQTLVWSGTAPVVGSRQSIELRSRDDDPVIFPQWRNTDLPILRAYGRTQWVEQHQIRDGEPGGLQEHVHDVGWWVQHSTGLSGIADALEQRLLRPNPVLDDVPIVPDARLELGDIITLRDEHITGLNLRCLIEGIKLSGAEGEQDQSLTLRILAVNGREATYEELEHGWTTSAYTGLENEWSGEQYSNFENNPTRRGN